MTFQYSNIPFELSVISLRYYNDMFWYWLSMIQMGPTFLAGFYQMYNHFYGPYNPNKKKGWDTYLVRYMALPIPFYYLFDLLLSVYAGTFFIPCRFWLWYHHVVSMVVIPALIIRDEYEWQDTLIMATHTLLMKYPHIFFLNIIYIALVLYYNVLLYFSPLKEKWINRFLGKFFPFIYYSFVVVLVHDCNNALPNLY